LTTLNEDNFIEMANFRSVATKDEYGEKGQQQKQVLTIRKL